MDIESQADDVPMVVWKSFWVLRQMAELKRPVNLWSGQGVANFMTDTSLIKHVTSVEELDDVDVGDEHSHLLCSVAPTVLGEELGKHILHAHYLGKIADFLEKYIPFIANVIREYSCDLHDSMGIALWEGVKK